MKKSGDKIKKQDQEMTRKVVIKLQDVPFIESPDGTMRDSVMVTEQNCGSEQYMAGLFFVRPGTSGHADKHEGIEELYYIFAGRGKVVIDEVPHAIEAGDVVFIPGGSTHYLKNDSTETLGLFWSMGTQWNAQPAIQRELAKWRVIAPGTPWGPLPKDLNA
jgi:mannose-6-phosphate isomerase-like protein (cupin superfamily)